MADRIAKVSSRALRGAVRQAARAMSPHLISLALLLCLSLAASPSSGGGPIGPTPGPGGGAGRRDCSSVESAHDCLQSPANYIQNGSTIDCRGNDLTLCNTAVNVSA